MKKYEDEIDKSKVITYLVREIVLWNDNDRSYEEKCHDIQKYTREVWSEKYDYILNELSVCTKTTNDRIDYQLTFIECLKFLYLIPNIINTKGLSIEAIYSQFPTDDFRKIQYGGNFFIANPEDKLVVTSQVSIATSQKDDEWYSVVETYEYEFTNYKVSGIDGNVKCEFIYEIPLLNYYKGLLNINEKKNKRCLMIDTEEKQYAAYILFDKVTSRKISEKIVAIG